MEYADTLDFFAHFQRFDQPRLFPCGKSICVMSPVITALELKPSRVRNIFICSLVVFCASSRITKRIVQRAAAHERQRRDLDDSLFQKALQLVRVQHVVEGVVQRAHVGIDFLLQRAWQKPSRSPASTAGRARMMRFTCLVSSALTAMATAM